MITSRDILTDKDVAKLAGMSLYTFQERMRLGSRPGELDWRQARPVTNCRRRWWLREDVERVIRERLTVPEGGAARKA